MLVLICCILVQNKFDKNFKTQGYIVTVTTFMILKDPSVYCYIYRT